jgi:hypothetical protein
MAIAATPLVRALLTRSGNPTWNARAHWRHEAPDCCDRPPNTVGESRADPERERREPPLRVDCHCAGGVLDDYWQRDRVAFTASYSIAEALQAKKTVRLTSVPLCIADRVCDRRDTSLVQSGQP